MSNEQYPKFTLGEKLTDEQINYFDKNGFIHFRGVVSATEVKEIISSTEELQLKWISKGIKKINGVPVKYGHDENGKEIVHRFPFTSQYSESVHRFVTSKKVQSLKVLLPSGSRIAENEKDGVIVNHYVNTSHTVSMPTHLGKLAQGSPDITVQYKAVLFSFGYASFERG